MADMDTISSFRVPLALGGMAKAIPFAITTSGAGVPSLRDTYGGLLSVAGSGTNNRVITITCPKWVRTLSCPFGYNKAATINIDPVLSASAGTVVLTADADFFSGKIEGTLWVSSSTVD
jgi:hypothetical protein